MNKYFTASKEMSHEYCCTVVKLGDVTPIEGSDFLAQTLVEGRTIVVRKDQVKTGDVMFYASNESQLDPDFLHINNLYDDKSKNANPEVKGYFNNAGRVRMVKLRGVVSMGYLFTLAEIKAYCPKIDMTDKDLDDLVGFDFDEVNGENFIHAYVPPLPEERKKERGAGKRNARIAKFNRMIPGEFSFHYDTSQLERNMHRFTPETNITASIKLHGTSAIFGNVKVKKPRWGGIYERIFNKLPRFLQFTKTGYDVIYSSRSVIKNQYINKEVTGGYYKSDVWKDYFDILKPYISKDMTIYGEIVGYVTGSNTMIQKGYDYGCKPGENALMIYRIVTHDEDGKKCEWDVDDVRLWTIGLRGILETTNPELARRIHPIDILYTGTMRNLAPELDETQHWQENMLAVLKGKTDWGMEKNEPLCRNKVPREGIVVRINNDVVPEAFKLKCLKFLGKEAEMMDKGECEDIEMTERY